jgi:hypothetical protein
MNTPEPSDKLPPPMPLKPIKPEWRPGPSPPSAGESKLVSVPAAVGVILYVLLSVILSVILVVIPVALFVFLFTVCSNAMFPN